MNPLNDALSLIADLCLIGLSVTLLSNVVYTNYKAHWESSPVGRHLMKGQIAMLCMAAFGSAGLWFNETLWQHHIIRIVAIVWLWKVMSERIPTFKGAQTKEKDREREPA